MILPTKPQITENLAITQNRVLSEVSGVPTTFDFKGLTMDASSYVSDYSNRGNFKDHQDDFRFLWSEEASYYEGQLFTDVAGLEGISTVKGLQHAYANPQTYTIHTITSSNESVIDTLSLSSNTKSNMHADVQEGNTIITPDKPVMYGTFTGTLYISLDPEKTGLYAIGEQVANGGWTIDGIETNQYCYQEGAGYSCYPVYKAVKGARIYLHEDKQQNMIDCNISQTDFDLILNEPGYETRYGLPCYKPDQSLQFGDVEHTYKIATNGTKFFSPNKYNYWRA
ncbi:MAG: hypothetical protein ABIH78_04605, partial [Candidatus Peregrinibacteria bacterium]